MDHYELIRRMHYVDGLSQREIAAKLGHARKTITAPQSSVRKVDTNGDHSMATERMLIRIDLLPAEQKLLLKYAYPFEPEKEQLKSMIAKGELGTLTIRPYFLSLLLGDLCHSMTERAKGRTVDRLIELYQRLEYVEMTGDGTLDIL